MKRTVTLFMMVFFGVFAVVGFLGCVSAIAADTDLTDMGADDGEDGPGAVIVRKENGLIDWINGFEQKPAKVFVVHGENTVAASFAQCLKDDYGFDTYAPYSGTEFDLGTGMLLKDAVPVPIVRKASIVSDVYSRLKAAGERLLAVIEQSRGMSNKDMAKFADQINSLCDKWLK